MGAPTVGAGPEGVWAVVVAGGRGVRFGSRKQFASLAGRPVLTWAVEAASAACAGVVLVVPPDATDEPACAHPGLAAVVPGGTTRAESVRAGLAAVPPEATVIAVHDAARPLCRPEVWDRVLAAVAAGADGAVPVVAVTDTIVRASGDGTLERLDRSVLRAVQTPQAFGAAVLRRAHAGGAEATDDATLVAAVGGRVVAVEGHPANVKLTGPADLAVVEALLAGADRW